MSAHRRLARKIARLLAVSEWAYLVARRRPYVDLGAGLLLFACAAGLVSERFGDATLVSWLLVLAIDVALHGVCVWYQLHVERLMQEVYNK